jgi:hypothetical protein
MKQYISSENIKELNCFAKRTSNFESYLFPKLYQMDLVNISSPLDDIRNLVRNDIRFVLKVFILSKIRNHVEEMAINVK